MVLNSFEVLHVPFMADISQEPGEKQNSHGNVIILKNNFLRSCLSPLVLAAKSAMSLRQDLTILSEKGCFDSTCRLRVWEPLLLSGPNPSDATAMCDAIRIAHPQIASDTKKIFASDAKPHSLDLKSQENARKMPAKIL